MNVFVLQHTQLKYYETTHTDWNLITYMIKISLNELVLLSLVQFYRIFFFIIQTLMRFC